MALAAGVDGKPKRDPGEHAVAQQLADCWVGVVIHIAQTKAGGDVVPVASQNQSEVADLAVGQEVASVVKGRLGLQAGAREIRVTDSKRMWLHMLKPAPAVRGSRSVKQGSTRRLEACSAGLSDQAGTCQPLQRAEWYRNTERRRQAVDLGGRPSAETIRRQHPVQAPSSCSRHATGCRHAQSRQESQSGQHGGARRHPAGES